MVKQIYKEKLLDPRWQKLRLEVMQRENFTCEYCGDKTKTLNIHHLCYNVNGNPWDVDDCALECLCEDCHYVQHVIDRLDELTQSIINDILTIAVIYSEVEHPVKDMLKQINVKVIEKYPKPY